MLSMGANWGIRGVGCVFRPHRTRERNTHEEDGAPEVILRDHDDKTGSRRRPRARCLATPCSRAKPEGVNRDYPDDCFRLLSTNRLTTSLSPADTPLRFYFTRPFNRISPAFVSDR